MKHKNNGRALSSLEIDKKNLRKFASWLKLSTLEEVTTNEDHVLFSFSKVDKRILDLNKALLRPHPLFPLEAGLGVYQSNLPLPSIYVKQPEGSKTFVSCVSSISIGDRTLNIKIKRHEKEYYELKNKSFDNLEILCKALDYNMKDLFTI